MKTILQRRLERRSISPIRRALKHFSHFYTSGINNQTPYELAEEIINNLSIDWTNPLLRFLDVKSNCGTFSLLLIEKLLEAGHQIDYILDNMIWAIERDFGQWMLSNATFKRTFGRTGNLIHGNFIQWQTDMKFDVIVGNPPYQNGKNSNFYVGFISKSATLLKEDGVLAFVVPNRFTLPHHPCHLEIAKHFRVTQAWVDVNSHFKGVGQNIGMFIANRDSNGNNGLTKIHLRDGTIEGDFDMVIPSKMPTTEGLERWKELTKKDTLTVVKEQPIHQNYVFICRQWKSQGGRIYFDAEVGHNTKINGVEFDIVIDKTPSKKRDGRYVVTDTPQQLCEFLRTTPLAKEIHDLFGDQMNLWPFLWDYIPSDKNS